MNSNAAEEKLQPVELKGLSVSKLRTYLVCARRYYYAYGEGIFEPPTAETRFGNYLHAVLEVYLKELVKARQERNLELLYSVAHRKRAEFAGIPDSGELSFAEADVMLNRFASREIDPERIYGLERAFRLTLNGEPAVALEGRIDRVDVLYVRGGESWLHLIDYKSGRHKLDEAALAVDLQLKFYVTAAYWLYRKRYRRFRFTLAYLRDGSEVSVETAYQDADRLKIVERMRQIRADREFVRTVAPHCRRCPAYKVCRPNLKDEGRRKDE